MAGDAPSAAEYEHRIAALEALVAQQARLIETQREVIARLSRASPSWNAAEAELWGLGRAVVAGCRR